MERHVFPPGQEPRVLTSISEECQKCPGIFRLPEYGKQPIFCVHDCHKKSNQDVLTGERKQLAPLRCAMAYGVRKKSLFIVPGTCPWLASGRTGLFSVAPGGAASSMAASPIHLTLTGW